MASEEKKVEEEKIKKIAVTSLEKWALEDVKTTTSTVFTPAFFHMAEFPWKEVQAFFDISFDKEKCFNELISIAELFCNSTQLETLQRCMKRISWGQLK